MIDSPSRTHILIHPVVGDEWQGTEPNVFTSACPEASSLEPSILEVMYRVVSNQNTSSRQLTNQEVAQVSWNEERCSHTLKTSQTPCCPVPPSSDCTFWIGRNL